MCGQDLISRCQVQSAWRDLKYSLLCTIPTAVEAFFIIQEEEPSLASRLGCVHTCARRVLHSARNLQCVPSADRKLLKLPLYNDAQVGKTDWFSDPHIRAGSDCRVNKPAASIFFGIHNRRNWVSPAVPFLQLAGHLHQV